MVEGLNADLLAQLLDVHGPSGAEPPLTSASSDSDLSASDNVTSAALRLSQWAADTRFQTGVASVSVLRYLSEHVSKLPLSSVVRMLDTHDVILAMVPLIENPPTVRKVKPPQQQQQRDGGSVTAASAKPPAPVMWQKYVGTGWQDVPPSELLRLTSAEVAPWLTIYNLTHEPSCRSRYALHSHRKGTLLRVRKYLTPVLLEQVALFGELQRYLDELALVVVPEPKDVKQAGLLLQAVPEVRERALKAALTPPKGWKGKGRKVQAAAEETEKAAATTTTPSIKKLASSSTGASHSSALLDLESKHLNSAGDSGESRGSLTSGLASLLTITSAASSSQSHTNREEASSSSSGSSGTHGAHAGAGGSNRSADSWDWSDAAAYNTSQLLRASPTSISTDQYASMLRSNMAAGSAAAAPVTTSSKPASTTRPSTAIAAAGITDGDDDEKLLTALAGPPKCEVCGTTGDSVKRCSRCKNSYYCGRDCQLAAWKDHAPLCDLVARNRAT